MFREEWLLLCSVLVLVPVADGFLLGTGDPLLAPHDLLFCLMSLQAIVVVRLCDSSNFTP